MNFFFIALALISFTSSNLIRDGDFEKYTTIYQYNGVRPYKYQYLLSD